MTSSWRLRLCRALALGQAIAWFALLPHTSFNAGPFFALLAGAAAVAAAGAPRQSSLLLSLPVVIEALAFATALSEAAT